MPLVRCCLCRQSRRVKGADFSTAANQGNGTWNPTDVWHGQVWLPNSPQIKKANSFLFSFLAILSARQSPQARKSVPIWDEFCAVPPARSISPPRWEEWQGLAINIANPFTKKMVIRMDFEGRRRSSQPLSSPCLKPGASRSFFGHFSGSGYFGSK